MTYLLLRILIRPNFVYFSRDPYLCAKINRQIATN